MYIFIVMCHFIKFECLLVLFSYSFKDKEHWSKTYMYHKQEMSVLELDKTKQRQKQLFFFFSVLLEISIIFPFFIQLYSWLIFQLHSSHFRLS